MEGSRVVGVARGEAVISVAGGDVDSTVTIVVEADVVVQPSLVARIFTGLSASHLVKFIDSLVVRLLPTGCIELRNHCLVLLSHKQLPFRPPTLRSLKSRLLRSTIQSDFLKRK